MLPAALFRCSLLARRGRVCPPQLTLCLSIGFSPGVALDQGIAYVLVFAALVLTYLIHPLDAFPYNLF